MVIIPARGTVKFIVWTYDDHPEYQADPPVVIDGPREWLRPAVALLVHPDRIDEYTGLNAEAVVADEIGHLWPVYSYLGKCDGRRPLGPGRALLPARR
jgi:hypothetical protein